MSDSPSHVEQPLPANPEDRKAAAALSSLNTTEIAADSGAAAAPKPPSAADQEALGKAMSRLEIAAGGSKEQAKPKTPAAQTEVRKKAVNVKVSGEDVNLLMDQLDLTKIKATELLKAHDGNARRAITAFISPAFAARA